MNNGTASTEASSLFLALLTCLEFEGEKETRSYGVYAFAFPAHLRVVTRLLATVARAIFRWALRARMRFLATNSHNDPTKRLRWSVLL